MSLEALTGTTYGPFRLRISPEKVADYVLATGDDPERWTNAAPPSYAGALLFAVAPAFILSPEVGDHTKVLVHSDQHFRWHGPLTLGLEVSMTGTVAKVRERGGLNFVTFEVAVDDSSTGRLLDSTSTFLMGSQAAAEPGPDRGEPSVEAGSEHDPLPQIGVGDVPPVVRAASRLDLVRYAAASGDFNPIHFDHDAARSAGLEGIVVHGLLMAAWMSQVPARVGAGDGPLGDMKLRFRNALRPAAAAVLAGSIADEGNGVRKAKLTLTESETVLVTATGSTAGR